MADIATTNLKDPLERIDNASEETNSVSTDGKKTLIAVKPEVRDRLARILHAYACYVAARLREENKEKLLKLLRQLEDIEEQNSEAIEELQLQLMLQRISK